MSLHFTAEASICISTHGKSYILMFLTGGKQGAAAGESIPEGFLKPEQTLSQQEMSSSAKTSERLPLTIEKSLAKAGELLSPFHWKEVTKIASTSAFPLYHKRSRASRCNSTFSQLSTDLELD